MNKTISKHQLQKMYSLCAVMIEELGGNPQPSDMEGITEVQTLAKELYDILEGDVNYESFCRRTGGQCSKFKNGKCCGDKSPRRKG